MPDEFENVIVSSDKEMVTVAWRNVDNVFYEAYTGQVIPAIAWMPLPAAYKPQSTCNKCKTYPAAGEHTCPYQRDVNNDDETLCNCCDECEQQCAADI